MPRPPITALVTTLNEVDNVEACLRSLDWADEVFLVDSYSTDGTVELVRERLPHVRIEQHEYLGAAAQKNRAIDRAAHDWIFVLDADERATPEVRQAVERALEGEAPPWAHSVHRRNFVYDGEIRHSGLQRDEVTRLFHRAHARYPNRRVHADLIVDGPVGALDASLLHYYVRSFDHMIEKMTRYAVWGAAQLFIDGQKTGAGGILGHAAGRFVRDYVVNLGFLDGARGLLVVGMHTFYTFWKYAKLWELNHLRENGRPVPLPPVDDAAQTWQMPWETKRDA
jgi:glycosyltransferase involved in cell wall biosynthesis